MRITTTLVQVAAVLAAAGCGGAVQSTTRDGGGGDGPFGDDDGGPVVVDANGGDSPGPIDSGVDVSADVIEEPICSGCGCTPPPTFDVSATAACDLLQPGGDAGNPQYGYMCNCNGLAPGPYYFCTFPQSFLSSVEADNGLDGSTWPAADSGVMLVCPTSPATITIVCVQGCTGRRTEGVGGGAGVAGGPCGTLGSRLAAMAHLEAVSVHAFARLESELRAHGAGPDLLRDARRARRDEARHTAMTSRLARRHGIEPVMPAAPTAAERARVRPLVDVALENAVEGCVRETYGALEGLVEARVTRDRVMARLMSRLAADECRHAELAWAVHAWTMARLGEGDRARVRQAMRAAAADLVASAPQSASLLFEALPLAA